AGQNGYVAPVAPVSITGDWTIVAWQYTSKGILPGWGGALDLNIAYLDAPAWKRYALGDRAQPVAPAPEPAPSPAEVPLPSPTPEPAPVPAPVVTPIPVTHEPTPAQTIPVTSVPAPVADSTDVLLIAIIKKVLQWLLGIPFNTKKQGNK